MGVGVQMPGVSIGINLPVQPQLVQVPGYPVYYAPQVQSNFFFYDGFYWVYEDDDWYASSWYNGPWRSVRRDVVPVFVLRVPVRYSLLPRATGVLSRLAQRRAAALGRPLGPGLVARAPGLE